MLEQDKERIGRYSHLMEGIKGKNASDTFHRKRVTAALMETQEQQLQYMKEDTLSTDIGTFQKYALPLIRRIYPTLPINDLVGVQPQLLAA